MLPTTEVNKDFLKLFYHEIVDHNLGNLNKLNLFILRIENNGFTYGCLIEELYDIIIIKNSYKNLSSIFIRLMF